MSTVPNDHLYVMQNDKKTHVLVPIDEYSHLTSAASKVAEAPRVSREVLEEADRKIADPNAEWLSTDELAASLAWSRIMVARRSRGLSQQALADLAGMSQSRVSRIERDPKRASVEDLRKIAAALDLNLGALVEAIARG